MNRLLSLFLVSVSSCLACGPWIPEAYVLRNDDVFYAPPEVGFEAELRYLMPDSVPFAAVLDDVVAPDAELEDALREADLSAEAQAEVLAEYRAFRSVLNTAKHYLDAQVSDHYAPRSDELEKARALSALGALEVPVGLPTEFKLYLAGALAYYTKDLAEARQQWQGVLDLPIEECRVRSVMAAYMLGKLGDSDAPQYFQLVRELAAQGLPDVQGLAAASYGREARYFLYDSDVDERYALAMDLYLRQWSAGYRNAGWSLKTTAREALQHADDGMLQALAADAQSRAVLTSYLMSSYGVKQQLQRFLQALPSQSALKVSEAGRFALIEYQQNNISATRLWLEYADPEDALALWVRSKLLLRDGKVEEGRTLMLALTTEMEAERVNWRRVNTEHAWGELGLLMLKKKSFVEAADCFYKSGSWGDCAYVLERLLEADELIALGQAFPEVNSDAVGSDFDRVQGLIARRLMRAGRFEDALGFFDGELQQSAMRYIAAMQAASDSMADSQLRALNYWTAAKIMREDGLSLFGSELAPDFAWHGGYFEWSDTFEQRADNYYKPDYQLNHMTREEEARAEATRVRPNHRFHYRYRAVLLAELAAGLLPNNDENTARIYCTAGEWLRVRDPDAADRLYKQLVVRCPETDLGAAASELNWLPPVDVALIEPFAEE